MGGGSIVTFLLFLSTPSARRATWNNGGNAGLFNLFLSTPSARRATVYDEIYISVYEFLSTPSARRATQARQRPCASV